MMVCIENKPRRFASLSAKSKARAIKQLLDSGTEKPFTLKLLEKEFTLSRNHLESGFRELYGTTIGCYTRNLKLKSIMELLKDYTLTLDTIAIRTGFNGGEALSRFFKKAVGKSPGRWRKENFDTIP